MVQHAGGVNLAPFCNRSRLDDLQLLLGFAETSFEFFSPHEARTSRTTGRGGLTVCDGKFVFG